MLILVVCFSVTMHCNSYEALMRAKQNVCVLQQQNPGLKFGASKMHLVLLLWTLGLLLLPLFGGSMFGPCFVVHCFVSFYCCNHLDGEKRAGWFLCLPDALCFPDVLALSDSVVG